MIYAITGVEPEVGAYAMAKYSRSSLSMKESLASIDSDKSASFLNTFYFQYGHKSIADLAHLTFAIEQVSLLAAIEIEDEQRWDGQEQSTRYQDFSRPNFFVPWQSKYDAGYKNVMSWLFNRYNELLGEMKEKLRSEYPCPPDQDERAHARILHARACDTARYVLPLGTLTSLGQIVNARALSGQISRLAESPYYECSSIAEDLRKACASPAYNPLLDKIKKAIDEECVLVDDASRDRMIHQILGEGGAAPTLAKYTEARPWRLEANKFLAGVAAEWFGRHEAPEHEVGAKLYVRSSSAMPDIDIVANLLYPHTRSPYDVILYVVDNHTEKERLEIIREVLKDRHEKDELPRAFQSGYDYNFDAVCDIGAFRDLHRHRRCAQFHQEYSWENGFCVPESIAGTPLGNGFAAWMRQIRTAVDHLRSPPDNEIQPGDANDRWKNYAMPLAYKKRTLFKMDLGQLIYMIELRSTPKGHISYRRIAWDMFQELNRYSPGLARLVRVTPPEEGSLLQR